MIVKKTCKLNTNVTICMLLIVVVDCWFVCEGHFWPLVYILACQMTTLMRRSNMSDSQTSMSTIWIWFSKGILPLRGTGRSKMSKKFESLYVSYRYELWNGYRPAPVDLSNIILTAAQEAIVGRLAENDHNVWAKDRIKQGWSYGPQQVGDTKAEWGPVVSWQSPWSWYA